MKKKRVYLPLDPQPKADEVVTLQRYYASLREDKTYKKRVTYLWEGGLKSKFAFVEYVGKFPGLEQIRNKRRTEKNKEENACNGHNVADQILVVENMVSQNHPFVRTIIRDKNKTPCIILYTDEQIEDLKNICCNGDAVLGVDKTFYLCKMHVTITCYKQTSVIRHDTNEHPIF